MPTFDRITVDPAQCVGRPCVRGLRIRVSDVLDLLAARLSPGQIVEELPDRGGGRRRVPAVRRKVAELTSPSGTFAFEVGSDGRARPILRQPRP